MATHGGLSSPPSLHVAQILADLNALEKTDPKAAFGLLHASKSAFATCDNNGSSFRSNGDSKLPQLSRYSSAISTASGIGSATSGSTDNFLEHLDEDIRRAHDLIRLHSQRANIKGSGEIGLARAKERVDSAVAKRMETQAGA